MCQLGAPELGEDDVHFLALPDSFLERLVELRDRRLLLARQVKEFCFRKVGFAQLQAHLTFRCHASVGATQELTSFSPSCFSASAIFESSSASFSSRPCEQAARPHTDGTQVTDSTAKRAAIRGADRERMLILS